MRKNYLPMIVAVVLMIATFLSPWRFPAFSPLLGMVTLLLTLALSTYAIFQKHKGTEHARPKILKDAGVMVFTLVIVIFIGGIAAMLANVQVSARWGEVTGLVSAIAAGFGVGYLVRKGMVKFAG